MRRLDPNQTSSGSDIRDRHEDNFLVVGLGGSAGAIHAFQEFFRSVPEKTGIAYVVVLHLSPDHESRLAEVLQGSTTLPVTQIQDEVRIEPDHVYVVAPKGHLSLTDRLLTSSESTTTQQRRAPIDIFFRALAASHDSNACAAILSGTGSDGSLGIKRIKECNGLVLAQDPAEAEFAEMPRSSIATGLVDEVLPAGAMIERIIAFRDRIRDIAPEISPDRTVAATEEALTGIFTALRVRTGHDFTNYKRATVLRRIARRMGVRQVNDIPSYASHVQSSPGEAQLLLNDLLISVTNFFRGEEAFEALERTVIPQLFRDRGAGDQVRVWVPGCATGEEAYSIAILLAEYMEASGTQTSVQLFATDIDAGSIAKARAGCYTTTEVADVSEERLRRWFLPERDGLRIRREIREMVLFANHNLLKDPPFSHLGLVSCRNLLIYFNRAAQERALEVFHFALRQEGHLFLGGAESIEAAPGLFSAVDKDAHIFQSRGAKRGRAGVPALAPPLPVVEPLQSSVGRRAAVRGRNNSAAELHHRLLDAYGPPSLVVDDDYEILHLSEKAAGYVLFTGGEASLNLLRVAHPELRTDLRSALYEAGRTRAAVSVSAVPLRKGDDKQLIDIVVRPVLREDAGLRTLYLILLEDTGTSGEHPSDGTQVIPASPHTPARVEEEIVELRAQLRATVEQHETHTEELKAANEELQAMNEELRSATEELETSREELQSVNEELHTVNQELRVKIEELSHTNDDMRNLMSSTEIGTVFLDGALRVKLFTPRAQDIFNFIQADIGRPIRDITNRIAGDVNLILDMERVMERLQTIEREVETHDGRWHIMRVLPYRTAEDRIEGVVMTFLDITSRKQAEQDLVESNVRADEQTASRTRTEELLGDKSELLRRIVEAQEEERRRLARELHDEMGQHLTALKIGIESLPAGDGEDASAHLRKILADVNDSIDRLAFELRPAALTDMGLEAAVGQLTDHFTTTTGTPIDLHVRGMDGHRLAGFIEATLYRATQEALTNIAKHTEAGNVSVMLERRRDQVQLIVEDDGQGFDPELVLQPPRKHAYLGLLGIKERTELTGGSFQIESKPGEGTSIYVRIPLTAGDELQ